MRREGFSGAKPNGPSGPEARAPNGWSHDELIGFRRGDEAVLGRIYHRYAPDIALMLRRGFGLTTGDGNKRRFRGFDSALELHDALHETFRRAFEPRAREHYDGLRPYGPYLRTIARNVVLQADRKYRLRFADVDDVRVPDPPSSDQGDPELATSRAQTQELVRRFIAGLSEADRALVTTRFVHGNSQRDTARLLGLGRQQVRTREDRIRTELVRFLRERGELEPLSGVLPWVLFVGLAQEVLR